MLRQNESKLIMKNITAEAFFEARNAVREQAPLIHCITNPISINDCANAVLALGAKPIMAEHPKEVCGITAIAKALAVNLGNITDARAESIMLSGHQARAMEIPSVIDVVGTACSPFRMELAQRFIRECTPAVVKGNLSEVKAIAGADYEAKGIDAGIHDMVSSANQRGLHEAAVLVKNYAASIHAVVMASGAVDIISDGRTVYFVENGAAELAKVTGTGCMLNVITGTYLSVTEPLIAAVLSAVTLGICGETADSSHGTGSYRTELMDALSTLEQGTLAERMKVRYS